MKMGVIPLIGFFTASELKNAIVQSRFQILEFRPLKRDSTEYFVVAGKL
jgi:hypothetical protein